MSLAGLLATLATLAEKEPRFGQELSEFSASVCKAQESGFILG
jgi:hypothetical protein